jgi:hypothetical protein
LEDVRRTIDRWFFWVSVSGVVYVTPRAGPLDLSDLTDMIARLGFICDDKFPALIAFEFPDSSLTPKQWNDVRTMLKQFATDISATIRLVAENATTGTLILFHRNIDRPEPEASEIYSLLSLSKAV